MSHRIARLVLLCLILVLLGPAPALAALTGPTYPAPGGTDFVGSGAASAGDPGGRNFGLSNIQVGDFSQLFYGLDPALIQVSLTGGSGLTTLSYDAGASDLPNGVARWSASGIAYNNPSGPPNGPLDVRFTLTQASPGASAFGPAPAEIAGAGAVIDVLQTGSALTVNLLFEAEFPPNSNNWVAINTLEQPQSPPDQTRSEVTTGFYYEQTPAAVPTLAAVGLIALACVLLGSLVLLTIRSGRRVQITG